MSRSPGIAVLGSMWMLKKRSRVSRPRSSSPPRVPPSPPAKIDGRSRGTNELPSTWWWVTARCSASTPTARSVLSWACARASHASRVSGLGASVRGTSVSAPTAAACRPRRPVGTSWVTTSAFGVPSSESAGGATNGQIHATSSWVGAAAERSTAIMWVTKPARGVSLMSRSCTSSGYTPLPCRRMPSRVRSSCTVRTPLASAGTSSRGMRCRVRVCGNVGLSPRPASKALRDNTRSWTVSVSCRPSMLPLVRNPIVKMPVFEVHASCDVSASAGAFGSVCAVAGTTPATQPRTSAAKTAIATRRITARAPDDRETGGEDVEPERLVEREGGVVLELRVHERAGHALPPEPVHRVGDERVTDAEPSLLGVDRDALEVPLVTRPPRDRVPGEGRLGVGTGGAELADRSGVERVAQPERPEAPERRKGEIVECEHARQRSRRVARDTGSSGRPGSPVMTWVRRWRRSRTVKQASTNGSPSAGPMALVSSSS